MLARIRLLTATLWAGSLWTIGYIAAPTLFATLSDRMLAGTIAGRLFRIEAWLSVACAVALLLLIRAGANSEVSTARRHLSWLIIGMLTCTLIGYFGLQPFMAELREAASGAGGVMDAESKARFGVLHGISSVFYLVQSLLAIALVLKIR
jgi:hypothetical protein